MRSLVNQIGGNGLPNSRVFRSGGFLDTFTFHDRCDIWKPPVITTDPVTKQTTNSVLYTLVAMDVHCFFVATEEVDTPSGFGRTKFANINTFDVFYFPEGTDVQDTYAIVFRTAGDNYNGVWKAQGNPQSLGRQPMHPLSFQKVFVLREGQPPQGVTNPARYGF